MKNRERLLKTNPYDLLLKAHKGLRKHGLCVIQFVGLSSSGVVDRCSDLCELCIERWLNEEAKPCRK